MVQRREDLLDALKILRSIDHLHVLVVQELNTQVGKENLHLDLEMGQ